jgi:hypothetical protein
MIISSLGAGIPELASHFERDESTFGQLFAFRGGGYLLGSLLAARMVQIKSLSNESIIVFSVYLSGLSTFCSVQVSSFELMKVMLVFQG